MYLPGYPGQIQRQGQLRIGSAPAAWLRNRAGTPLMETALALSQIVTSGKALYIGISNYDGSGALPIELVESARIDGANEITIFSRIVVPCIKPGILTLCLLIFLWSWNNYMIPLSLMEIGRNRMPGTGGERSVKRRRL